MVDRISQTVPDTSSEEEYEHIFIGALTNDLNTFDEENDWCIDLNTNGSVVNFKIDTGAQANVLPWNVYSKLSKIPKLNKSKVKLTAYNGTDIPVRGSCIAQIDYKRSSIPVLFIMADIDSSPVIGLNTSSKLNLIKRVLKIKQDIGDLPDYLHSFSECFGEIGCLSRTHHIEIDPSIQPRVNPPRHLPISLQHKIYKEIQRMIKMNIIVPVLEPTDWVNNFVAVEKPNYDFVLIHEILTKQLNVHIMYLQLLKKF